MKKIENLLPSQKKKKSDILYEKDPFGQSYLSAILNDKVKLTVSRENAILNFFLIF